MWSEKFSAHTFNETCSTYNIRCITQIKKKIIPKCRMFKDFAIFDILKESQWTSIFTICNEYEAFFVYFHFHHLLFTWNATFRHDWVDVWRCCIQNGRSKNCTYHIGRMVWRQAHCHHHVLSPNFICTHNRMVSAILWTLTNYSCPFRYFYSVPFWFLITFTFTGTKILFSPTDLD